MFGNIVKDFRNDNFLSQSEFVELIQRSSINFENLDVVTLSRWERNVTKPHLSRLNELLELIGCDIFDFWTAIDSDSALSLLVKKINVDNYISDSITQELDIIIINSTNSNIISSLLDKLTVIIEYESNPMFNEYLNDGLSIQVLFEKIINQYSGELTLALVNGQLIGHLLTINYHPSVDLIFNLNKKIGCNEKNCHLVASINCNHISAIYSIVGREVYKYMQSLNPDMKMYVYVNNKRIFDILYSMGFEYRSVIYKDEMAKLMDINRGKLKSQRIWMNIISNFKGLNNE